MAKYRAAGTDGRTVIYGIVVNSSDTSIRWTDHSRKR